MQPRQVTLSAPTADAAKSLAVKELGTPSANIIVEPAGRERWSATMINANAGIRPAISGDGMNATIAEYYPPTGQGKALTMEMLFRDLSSAGIVILPPPEIARTLVEAVNKGQDIVGVEVGRGIQPTPAQDARAEPLGNWTLPVFPQDAIATIIPPSDAKPGKRLTGEKVPPSGKLKGAGIMFPKDSGCYIDKTSLLIRSERYGIVIVDSQGMTVNDLVRVTGDGMKVITTVYTQDFKGNPVTLERMQSALEAYEITARVDGHALSLALAEATEKKHPLKDVVVCKGLEARHGKNGWFEMVYKDERSNVGIQADDGSIDYRARGVVRSVSNGELLGRLHPPEPGIPGRDVWGRVIPAREGEPFHLVVGDNVTSENGQDYFAADNGMVFFVKNKLAVSDVFQTQGDVCMGTGNIALEKGSVHVRGAILSGFKVTSPGNILVDEVIENAVVEAAGDVEVRGGILMDKTGRIAALGGVSALFATNATIQAMGDVNIAHEINNCIVFARRYVFATKGRGKIIGSTIRCGQGLEANEIGSSLGVQTSIFLGIERKVEEKGPAKKKELEQILQKIYTVLGTGDPRVILKQAQPDKRQAVASLLKARLKAEQKLKDLEQELIREREQQRQTMKARIKVHKIAHPGTIINCFGKVLKVTEPILHSQIYLDPDVGNIVVTPL